jgi:hypothetical protein
VVLIPGTLTIAPLLTRHSNLPLDWAVQQRALGIG